MARPSSLDAICTQWLSECWSGEACPRRSSGPPCLASPCRRAQGPELRHADTISKHRCLRFIWLLFLGPPLRSAPGDVRSSCAGAEAGAPSEVRIRGLLGGQSPSTHKCVPGAERGGGQRCRCTRPDPGRCRPASLLMVLALIIGGGYQRAI